MTRLRTILQQYIPEKQFFDTIEFFRDQKINNLYFIKSKVLDLTLYNHNLIGGDKYNLELKINNQTYKVHIEQYSDSFDKNLKIINFIKFNAKLDIRGDYKEDDHCGVLIIDKKEQLATIQSINNYNECIKCIEGNKPIKIGDILAQIMIIISMRNNIKKISLTDNSYLMCGNSKISLIHLRTMTKGMPFYSKYGFIPTYEEENEIFKENKKIFKEKPTLTKKELIKILNFKKFNEKYDLKIINYINNIIIPKLTEVNLVNKFVDNIINDKTNEGCSILYNIYMDIYKKIGYSKYEKRHFELDLTKSNLINSNK